MFTIRSGSNGSESITGLPAATEQDWNICGNYWQLLSKGTQSIQLSPYLYNNGFPRIFTLHNKCLSYFNDYSVRESQGLGSGGRSIYIDPDPQHQLYMADGAFY